MSEIEYLIGKMWQEYGLVEQFMYKNKNQQRNFSHFKLLQKIIKEFRLLREIQTLLRQEKTNKKDIELLNEELPGVLSNIENVVLKAGMELWRVINMQILLGFVVCAFCILSRLFYLVQAISHLQNTSKPKLHVIIQWCRNNTIKPPIVPIQQPKKKETQAIKQELKIQATNKQPLSSKISKKLMEKSKYLQSVFGILEEIEEGAISHKQKK